MYSTAHVFHRIRAAWFDNDIYCPISITSSVNFPPLGVNDITREPAINSVIEYRELS